MNISVIIPVYNAEAFLVKAVNSALQFQEVKEIILVEDCSTDDSLNICKKLSSENARIKLLQHPDRGNHGAAAARNLGLNQVKQEFMAFLDADDYYLPNRFSAEHEIFKDEKIEGVFGAIGVEFLSEIGQKEYAEKFNNATLTTVKKACEGQEVFRGLLGLDSSIGTFFHLNGLTIRTRSIHKNNLRFADQLRVHQDSDFILKLAHCSYLKSGEISHAIAIRGIHDDNRITKIRIYSQKYVERQYLLWKSIYDWAKNNHLQPDELNHILLQKNAFEIATKKGFPKIMKFLNIAFRHPHILKTRYRFTFLKR
ncbi:glycosyltransferase family 2 protein [Chryseobacterium sp. MP_3.2]|uniref:glycosyltransferase family 2 protein n=1 Tax=Chryseobacterium sp. MP_3.2 TaxID=3071712 RepID=UPI002DFE0907|nr:glycosyltransferase involved in cell wall biosynthesis [Chryseobacterium sp. MP_3.2]